MHSMSRMCFQCVFQLSKYRPLRGVYALCTRDTRFRNQRLVPKPLASPALILAKAKFRLSLLIIISNIYSLMLSYEELGHYACLIFVPVAHMLGSHPCRTLCHTTISFCLGTWTSLAMALMPSAFFLCAPEIFSNVISPLCWHYQTRRETTASLWLC
jgi:hypothetical protein